MFGSMTDPSRDLVSDVDLAVWADRRSDVPLGAEPELLLEGEAHRVAEDLAARDRSGLEALLAADDERIDVSVVDGWPGDLVQAISSQAGGGRAISWKVLDDTLRRLEADGYLARWQVPGVPRQTWYWLCPRPAADLRAPCWASGTAAMPRPERTTPAGLAIPGRDHGPADHPSRLPPPHVLVR